MLLVALAAAPPAAGARATALASFFDRLRDHGRAETRLVRETRDGAGPAVRGRVILEPPDRARLDFDRTGEQVTLRSDGGEWLQPQLRQCVKLGPARARAALRWWDLLLGRDPGAFTERALGGRTLLIVRAERDAPADSAWILLDSGGLPARIEIHPEGGLPEIYRLSGWRFSTPRGRAGFVIRTPHGYESVDMP